MRTNIFYFLLTCLLSFSCSTILKTKTYDLSIKSNLQNAKVEVNDSTYSLPTMIKVTRSKEDLELILIKDSLKKKFLIPSRTHSTFKFLNLFGGEIAPFFYAIDLTNPKKYHYGKSVFLNSKDSLTTPFSSKRKRIRALSFQPKINKKGNINWTLSFPLVNFFNYNHPDVDEKQISGGLLGFSTGLEYFYSENHYFGVKTYTATDFNPFVIIEVLLGNNLRENFNTVHFEITNNHIINSWHIGYGPVFSFNHWKRIDTREEETKTIDKTNQSFGITTNAYYQVAKPLFIGLIYRPSFYTVSPEVGFNYEHYIGLDLAFKIPLLEN